MTSEPTPMQLLIIASVALEQWIADHGQVCSVILDLLPELETLDDEIQERNEELQELCTESEYETERYPIGGNNL